MVNSFTDSLGSIQRPTRWLTPSHIVRSLGGFDLDPCGAPGHVLADHTFLLEDGMDGLVEPWFGRVWCNPPYGREAFAFVERMVRHGRGVLMIFARTDTKLFQDLIFPNASGIFFISRRVKFLRSDGVSAQEANAPSVLVSFGDDDLDALRSCGLRGSLVVL